MKLGSTDISKIYLGSTEVTKAYLGSTLVHDGSPSPVLPYDAEVEYLEGTGTQWIDTGVLVSSITKAQYQVLVLKDNMLACGARDGTNGRFQVANSIGIGGGYYTNSSVYPKNFTSYNIEMTTSGVLKINGTSYNASSGSFSSVSFNSSIYLFKINGQDVDVGTFRIYGVKFYNVDTLVSDMIPVRVGNVGYMYDKVSGNLLSNSGSGNFILGIDKDSTVYDSEVQYLQTDGTGYINTGVLVSAITKARYYFRIPSANGAICGARDGTNGRFQIADSIGVGGGYYLNNTIYPKYNTDFKVEMSTSGSIKINDTSYNATSGTFSAVSFNLAIYLFKLNNQSAPGTAARFYGAYFFDGDNVIAAFIPVRKNGVAYMYDRIGGQFYGNANGGSITYGNDLIT